MEFFLSMEADNVRHLAESGLESVLVYRLVLMQYPQKPAPVFALDQTALCIYSLLSNP